MPVWARLILVVLGAALTIGSVAWYVWASGRVAEARDWPRTEGIVVSTRIDEQRTQIADTQRGSRSTSRTVLSYVPVVAYTYRVGDRLYSSDTVWLTGGRSWDSPAGAEAFLVDYPRGGRVILVYDPGDPSDAALIVEAPAPLILSIALMGLILLAVGWLVPRRRPANVVGDWRPG